MYASREIILKSSKRRGGHLAFKESTVPVSFIARKVVYISKAIVNEGADEKEFIKFLTWRND